MRKQLKKALKEVELIQQGELPKKTARGFLKELREINPTSK